MGNPLRTEVWQRLAGDLKPGNLAQMTTTIDFSQLPETFEKFITGQVKGRIVVKINT